MARRRSLKVRLRAPALVVPHERFTDENRSKLATNGRADQDWMPSMKSELNHPITSTEAAGCEQAGAGGVNAWRRKLVRTALFSLSTSSWLAACGGGSTGTDAQALATSSGEPAPTPSPAPAPVPAPAPAPAPVSAPPPTTVPAPPTVCQSPPVPQAPPQVASADGPLPAWVPAPGNVALLTQSNGLLSNWFRDIVAPYYEPFYSVKIVNDYSTALKNPYWGSYGCTVFFGGGHAGTNDNMVAIAEYGTSGITFKRVLDPTPWFGTGTDQTTRGDNSIRNIATLMNTSYLEASIDHKPGSAHTYGSGDIVGPEYGGAANGTFARVITAAVGNVGLDGALASHELRFASTTTASDRLTWVRMSDESHPTGASWATPHLTAFVGPQQRIYIQTNDGGQNVRWYDRVQKAWIAGTGRRFDFDASYGGGANGNAFDSGIMFYVPVRGMLVCMYPLDDKLIVQWMGVTVAQPTLGGTATLSQELTLTWPWSAACWCPHNNRIIVAGVAGDNSAVYEIEIPTNACNTWAVSRAPFGAGQTFVPGDPAAGIGITYKKWHYDERLRAIVYMPFAAYSGDDKVWVYRPRST